MALFVAFNIGVLAVLAIDLGVFNKKAHKISVREAAIWSSIWITLSLAFAGVIYWLQGPQSALEFVTGYLIEYSLSIDNIFVIVLIFSYFRIPEKYQHRVLFWGIIGALLMRGSMIAAGAFLIERFHWIIYVFGAFLVFTGIRMATHDESDIEPEANPVLRLVRRLLPVTHDYRGQDFFVKEAPKRGEAVRIMATPLFVVLVLVETTDLIFAVDSIPAIFAVTRDPFLVYTSNVCAILGLRSLYFLLAGVIHTFRFLKLGVAVVLTFVGAKMLLGSVYEIPIQMSLLVIVVILVSAVVASIMFPAKQEAE
ncbi:MAG TPA: TerC family protein [Gemmatimonadaceae bacterium]|nr:TerC family protein [Gemmatimonadaceae bacterium]